MVRDMQSLPLYDVVNVEDASHGAARRLRLDVVIDPEQMHEADRVVRFLLRQKEYTTRNDTVFCYVWGSPDEVGRIRSRFYGVFIRLGSAAHHAQSPRGRAMKREPVLGGVVCWEVL